MESNRVADIGKSLIGKDDDGAYVIRLIEFISIFDKLFTSRCQSTPISASQRKFCLRDTTFALSVLESPTPYLTTNPNSCNIRADDLHAVGRSIL